MFPMPSGLNSEETYGPGVPLVPKNCLLTLKIILILSNICPFFLLETATLTLCPRHVSFVICFRPLSLILPSYSFRFISKFWNNPLTVQFQSICKLSTISLGWLHWFTRNHSLHWWSPCYHKWLLVNLSTIGIYLVALDILQALGYMIKHYFLTYPPLNSIPSLVSSLVFLWLFIVKITSFLHFIFLLVAHIYLLFVQIFFIGFLQETTSHGKILHKLDIMSASAS